MRLGDSVLYAHRERYFLFLFLYGFVLRCGQTVFGQFVYKLRRQHAMHLSVRPGRQRCRRMYDAGLFRQFRLRRGQAMPERRDNIGFLPELRGECAMHVPERISGKRFRRVRKTCLHRQHNMRRGASVY